LPMPCCQASKEATILLYAPALDRHLEGIAEYAVPWSSASMTCRESSGWGRGEASRRLQARPHGRPSHEVALAGEAEGQGTNARRKPQALGAGDSQGDPGRSLRSPALGCGGDGTAEARGEEPGRGGAVAGGVLHGSSLYVLCAIEAGNNRGYARHQ
jgi:hypothetical protein